MPATQFFSERQSQGRNYREEFRQNTLWGGELGRIIEQDGGAFQERQPHLDWTRVGHAVHPPTPASSSSSPWNSAGNGGARPVNSSPQVGSGWTAPCSLQREFVEEWRVEIALRQSAKEAEEEKDLQAALAASLSDKATAPSGSPPNIPVVAPVAAGNPPGGANVETNPWVHMKPFAETWRAEDNCMPTRPPPRGASRERGGPGPAAGVFDGDVRRGRAQASRSNSRAPPRPSSRTDSAEARRRNTADFVARSRSNSRELAANRDLRLGPPTEADRPLMETRSKSIPPAPPDQRPELPAGTEPVVSWLAKCREQMGRMGGGGYAC